MSQEQRNRSMWVKMRHEQIKAERPNWTYEQRVAQVEREADVIDQFSIKDLEIYGLEYLEARMKKENVVE